jgi:hypothetical protein
VSSAPGDRLAGSTGRSSGAKPRPRDGPTSPRLDGPRGPVAAEDRRAPGEASREAARTGHGGEMGRAAHLQGARRVPAVEGACFAAAAELPPWECALGEESGEPCHELAVHVAPHEQPISALMGLESAQRTRARAGGGSAASERVRRLNVVRAPTLANVRATDIRYISRRAPSGAGRRSPSAPHATARPRTEARTPRASSSGSRLRASPRPCRPWATGAVFSVEKRSGR